MITTTISLAMHLILSSYQGVRAVGRVLGYAYSSMAVQGPKIDFNTKHLKTGDPLPPYTGKLRVYNMRFCPFAQRTILALNAKKIDYEVINVDLVDKPEWIFTKSREGKVPSIEIQDGVVIYESLVTVEYLDEVYPQRPLLPKDPLKKAFDKIIIDVLGSSIHPYFVKLLKARDTITQDHIKAFHKGLEFIQEAIKTRGTTYLDGEEPGYVDYMIWPWFERLVTLDDVEIDQIKSPKYALLAAYIDKMLEDPVVSEYLIPKDILIKFNSAYLLGLRPDYELLKKSLSS